MQIKILCSYIWHLNSCFFDTGLELLFRVFLLWHPDILSALLDDLPSHCYMKRMLEDFKRRQDWIKEPTLNARQGSRILTATQAFLRYFMTDRWKLQDYGSPGSLEEWLSIMLYEAKCQVGHNLPFFISLRCSELHIFTGIRFFEL